MVQQTIVFDFECTPEEMPVEKSARIFEAGEYPDKGITVTEADLDAIVEGFAECPVKVEHADSPLDPLGTVKRIWRKGKELFATLAFPQDLASFLERRGIRRLSVGLLRDPLRLAEVSLVLSPRVAGAAMFRDAERNRRYTQMDADQTGPDFDSIRVDRRSSAVGSDDGEEVKMMSEDEKDRRIEELKFALRSKVVEARLELLRSQGKIVPASEPFARDLLMQGEQVVKFAEREATVGEVFLNFIEAQPKVIEFGELTPAKTGMAARILLSVEEEDVLSKLGVSREQVEKYA